MLNPRSLARSAAAALAVFIATASAQPAAVVFATDAPQFGPYNATFLADGPGLAKPIPNPRDPILLADAPWSLFCWIKASDPIDAFSLVAGLGSTTAEYPRYLGLDSGKIVLWLGEDNQLTTPASLKPGEWHLLAATFDGARFHLSADGQPASSGTLTLGSTNPLLQMAPTGFARHFGGQIASFTLLRHALSDSELHQLFLARPDFSLVQFEEASKPWPVQTRGQAGYRAPQDPATMPVSRAPFSAPVAIQRPAAGPSLTASSDSEWAFSDGWTMREAPKVDADGAHISTAAYNASGWMRATVPGTVLTTMVDDGVYPDPYYGLNNLAIPESLNKQDYWYRNEFTPPAAALAPGAHAELTFEGINYAASVWLNGKLLGAMKGAFRRGTFDVTSVLKPGQKNVLAVRISPPPHPGIPQEQSILGGPGENGGSMALDGPTFVATEGWDWIPASATATAASGSRSRCASPTASSSATPRSSPPSAITTPRSAAVDIAVPVTNLSSAPVNATLTATIEQDHRPQERHSSARRQRRQTHSRRIRPAQPASPAPVVAQRLRQSRALSPQAFPRSPAAPSPTPKTSASASARSAMSSACSTAPAICAASNSHPPSARRDAASPIVDVSHDGMREVPLPDAEAAAIPEERRADARSHVASLAPGAENSPAIEPLTDLRAAPYLVLRVNGVRIAARGGNWGMDDARKRVSREHLEPFFRLNRDAGLNIIRNWVGPEH